MNMGFAVTTKVDQTCYERLTMKYNVDTLIIFSLKKNNTLIIFIKKQEKSIMNILIYFLALFSLSSYTVSSVGSVVVDNIQRIAVLNANTPYKIERIIYLVY